MSDTVRGIIGKGYQWASGPAGWVCPKCGRVWGPQTPGCGPCNTAVEAEESAKHTRDGANG